MISHSILRGLALLMLPTALVAQNALTTAESYRRARALVDASIAAHGGDAALAKFERIRVTLEGRDFWRNQSARVAPPYDARPSTIDLMLDLPASKLVNHTTSVYPGDLVNSAIRVTNGDKAFRFFDTNGIHLIDRASPVPTILPYLVLPSLALSAAKESAHSLRYLGPMKLSSGATLEAIVVNPPSTQLTLGFDPTTKQLRAILNASGDALAGDTGSETEFLDYRMLNGLSVPTRRVTRVAGEITQDLRYASVTPDYTIPDSVLTTPATSRAFSRKPPSETVVTHAPGVWSVWAGAWVLAVALDDYVVVVEAPGGATEAVIDEVAKLAPSKPIRYVVPTHHHDDHSSGVRDYTAKGVTIVTTPGNRAYFERMAAANLTLDGDLQSVARRRPTIETFTGKRLFTDGSRTLEIHDIGPNPHAAELLVAWVPGPGVLYEADMLTTSPDGMVPNNVNMDATVAFAKWIEQHGWNVHQFAGMHHPPLAPSVLDTILAQPIRAPIRP